MAEVDSTVQSPRAGGAVVTGYLLAVLSAAFHAGVPVAGKYAQVSLNTLTYCFLWVLCAALYGAAWFTISRKWPAVLAQARRHWRAFVLMGLCQVGTTWFFFLGVRYLDPTVSAFVGQSTAIFALVLGTAFLSERFNRFEAFGILLTIAGAFVISWGGGEVIVLGVAAVLVSRVFFALFTFIGKMRVGGVDPVVLVTGATASAAGFYIAWATLDAAAGLPSFDFHAPVGAYAAIAVASFFGAFVGISTFYRAMKTIGFAVGWALRSTQPVFVAVLSFFTLGLLPDFQGWVGGAIIMAGVALITLAGAKAYQAGAAGKTD